MISPIWKDVGERGETVRHHPSAIDEMAAGLAHQRGSEREGEAFAHRQFGEKRGRGSSQREKPILRPGVSCSKMKPNAF